MLTKSSKSNNALLLVPAALQLHSLIECALPYKRPPPPVIKAGPKRVAGAGARTKKVEPAHCCLMSFAEYAENAYFADVWNLSSNKPVPIPMAVLKALQAAIHKVSAAPPVHARALTLSCAEAAPRERLADSCALLSLADFRLLCSVGRRTKRWARSTSASSSTSRSCTSAGWQGGTSRINS